MNALAEKKIYKALFISPIVDMERLIKDMMKRSDITEAELEKKREIITKFGEKILWEYLSYVRNNPILWNIPTCILYGGKDNLTSKETMTGFANRIGAALTIMRMASTGSTVMRKRNSLINGLKLQSVKSIFYRYEG